MRVCDLDLLREDDHDQYNFRLNLSGRIIALNEKLFSFLSFFPFSISILNDIQGGTQASRRGGSYL